MEIDVERTNSVCYHTHSGIYIVIGWLTMKMEGFLGRLVKLCVNDCNGVGCLVEYTIHAENTPLDFMADCDWNNDDGDDGDDGGGGDGGQRAKA